jgi:hypothetical protein
MSADNCIVERIFAGYYIKPAIDYRITMRLVIQVIAVRSDKGIIVCAFSQYVMVGMNKRVIGIGTGFPEQVILRVEKRIISLL